LTFLVTKTVLVINYKLTCSSVFTCCHYCCYYLPLLLLWTFIEPVCCFRDDSRWGHTFGIAGVNLRATHPSWNQCSRIHIFFKIKKTWLRFLCFFVYVFANNDRQCLLHLEVYQIASLHCVLWNNKQLHLHTTLYKIVDSNMALVIN